MAVQAPEVLLTYLRQGFAVADVAPVVLPPNSSLDAQHDVAQQLHVLWLKTIQGEIEQGRVAWQPVRNRAALYTALPKHPKTGELLKAHPVLTGWGVAFYGESLFQAYQKTVSALPVATSKALDRQAFHNALLKGALPTHPAVLARLSEEQRQAQRLPADQAKPSMDYKQLDEQGQAVRISWRSNSRIQQSSAEELLPLLQKLKVGPRTLRGDSQEAQNGDPSIYNDSLVAQVLSGCGTDGLVWLQAQGFEPQDDWFLKAHTDATDPVELINTWEALKAIGLNVEAETDRGNLWHATLHYPPKPLLVDWIRNEGASWHLPNRIGHTPLGLALQQLYQPLHTLYTLQKNGHRNFSLLEHYPQFDLVKNLVVDMLKDGADLYHVDGWGRTPRHGFPPFDLAIDDFLARKKETVNPMKNYRDVLLLEPEAYSPSQRAVLDELEQRSGVNFFQPAPAPKKRLTP